MGICPPAGLDLAWHRFRHHRHRRSFRRLSPRHLPAEDYGLTEAEIEEAVLYERAA